ncbi:MAG: phage fiber-tail adaptor protein [Methanosarcinaceae archaeon]
MTEKAFPKTPDAVLDYVFDWITEWLETSEIITSHIVTVDTGLTKDSDIEFGGFVTIWLSGGTEGVNYEVACKITSSMGRTEERNIMIRCGDR